MRQLSLVLTLLLTLPAAAQGAQLKLDITYTNGQILSGPLTVDFAELPKSVAALFLLNADTAGDYSQEDVVESSLAFGNGGWSLGDLDTLNATLFSTDGVFTVTALTYSYGPINTPTASDRIATNFPLQIQGTDLASGQAFLYQYDTSNQSMTMVPKPSTLALTVAGLFGLMVLGLRRRSA